MSNNGRRASPGPEHEYSSGSSWNYRVLSSSHRFIPWQPTLGINRGGHDASAATLMTRPGLASFLNWESPPPPVHILVINSGRTRARESPPRLTGQVNMQEDDSPRLTQYEQLHALKKLKKEVYNPVPKRMTNRLCLYYRDRAKEITKEKEEEGKRCAICLEDFEVKEVVMLTPCSHMFHEECIVPWVKSRGQCPVCRFGLCERTRDSLNNHGIDNVTENDLPLVTIVRALEEAALALGNTDRQRLY